MNSTISFFTGNAPFNAIKAFKDEYRCITADLRNANGGQSSGPLEIDRPWDAYADDHLGLMGHLGIGEFLVMGFCIGGPFIWNLLRRAPERIVAAVLLQPSGFRPEMPDLSYQNNITGWGPALCARRPDITMEQVDAFLNTMYRANADFVFTCAPGSTQTSCAWAHRNGRASLCSHTPFIPRHLLAGGQLGMLPYRSVASPPGQMGGEALKRRRVIYGIEAGGAVTSDIRAIPAEQKTQHFGRVYEI